MGQVLEGTWPEVAWPEVAEADRPVCPECGEEMVRAHIDMEDGEWMIVWLCSCCLMGGEGDGGEDEG